MIKKFTEQDMQNYADYVAKAVLSNITPNLDRWYAEWHKPTKKVIDLSVLIDSQIDCEFDNGAVVEFKRIAKLVAVKVDSVGTYYSSNHKKAQDYRECQPRMNHIHAWRGGECPLPEGFEVLVVRRDESQSGVMNVESVNWNHVDRRPRHICEGMSVSNSGGADIMAFEVLGLADGYVMPWEQDNE